MVALGPGTRLIRRAHPSRVPPWLVTAAAALGTSLFGLALFLEGHPAWVGLLVGVVLGGLAAWSTWSVTTWQERGGDEWLARAREQRRRKKAQPDG